MQIVCPLAGDRGIQLRQLALGIFPVLRLEAGRQQAALFVFFAPAAPGAYGCAAKAPMPVR